MQQSDKDTIIRFIQDVKAKKPLSQCEDISYIMSLYRNFHKEYKKILDEYEKGNKTYTYMLTFTIDPNKHDVKNLQLHNEIELLVYNYAIARKPLRADYVKEGTDKDHKHTHFHLGLEMKKYIDFSNSLKNYRKKFGIVDISRSWSNDYNNILIYINKSVPSVKIGL